jgi:hypothetical protein
MGKKTRPKKKKGSNMGEMVRPLTAVLDSFSAGTIRVYGFMAVRPGDMQMGLVGVSSEENRLDLIFEAASASGGQMTISVHDPGGLSLSPERLTIHDASRISMGTSLDARVEGQRLRVTSDNETSTRPLFDGAALELS